MSDNQDKPYVLWVQDRNVVEPAEGPLAGPPKCFSTFTEAVDAAQAVIDEYMFADRRLNPTDRPLQFLDSLLDFGYMPYITGPDVSILDFDPRKWAERRCYEIAGWEVDCPEGPTGRPLPDDLKLPQSVQPTEPLSKPSFSDSFGASLRESIEQFKEDNAGKTWDQIADEYEAEQAKL